MMPDFSVLKKFGRCPKSPSPFFVGKVSAVGSASFVSVLTPNAKSGLNGVSPEDLGRKGRNNAISRAKTMVVRAGIRNLGMRQKEITKKLGVSQVVLSQIYCGFSNHGIGDILLS
jgi:hypothetical protein